MSNIVCCCDFGDCEMLALHRRNAVLSTLCGLRVFPEVVDAANVMQASWRAANRRRTRRRFEQDRRKLFQRWLEAAAAIGVASRKRAATYIQRIYRGRNIRRLPKVRLLRKYIALSQTRLPVFNGLWPGIGAVSDSEHRGDNSSEATADTMYSSDDMDVDDDYPPHNSHWSHSQSTRTPSPNRHHWSHSQSTRTPSPNRHHSHAEWTRTPSPKLCFTSRRARTCAPSAM